MVKSDSNAFISGYLGGAASILAGHPFDTVKVNLQAQSASQNGRYSGPIDCLLKVFRSEGLKGLYKGALVPILGIGLCDSILLGVNEFSKQRVANYYFTTKDKLSFLNYTLCGFLGGAAGALPVAAIEHARIKMQLPSNTANYTGSVDAFLGILKKYKIRGLLKGAVPTFYRDSLSCGLMFGYYETAIKHLSAKYGSREAINPVLLGLLGGVAGSASVFPFYPFDCIKTIKQSGIENTQSMRQIAFQVVAVKGVFGLYEGMTPCMLRFFPSSVTLMLVFELTQKLF